MLDLASITLDELLKKSGLLLPYFNNSGVTCHAAIEYKVGKNAKHTWEVMDRETLRRFFFDYAQLEQWRQLALDSDITLHALVKKGLMLDVIPDVTEQRILEEFPPMPGFNPKRTDWESIQDEERRTRIREWWCLVGPNRGIMLEAIAETMLEMRMHPAPAKSDELPFSSDEEYRSVKIGDTRYELTSTEARAVKFLHENHPASVRKDRWLPAVVGFGKYEKPAEMFNSPDGRAFYKKHIKSDRRGNYSLTYD